MNGWPTGSQASLAQNITTSLVAQIMGINWPLLLTQAVVTATVFYLTIRFLQKSPIEEWLGLD